MSHDNDLPLRPPGGSAASLQVAWSPWLLGLCGEAHVSLLLRSLSLLLELSLFTLLHLA